MNGSQIAELLRHTRLGALRANHVSVPRLGESSGYTRTGAMPPLAGDYLSWFGIRHIYVLSLARRTDRRKRMAQQAARLPQIVPLTFIDGIDASTSPPLSVKQAVHLSWQNLLFHSIEQGAFPCMVVEDDVELLAVRDPCLTLPPTLPDGAAIVALAVNFAKAARKAHPECNVPQRNISAHAVTLSAHVSGFGFAGALLPTIAGATQLLRFLVSRNLGRAAWVDLDTYFYFRGASAICPPLLGYYASASDGGATGSTRMGTAPVNQVSTCRSGGMRDNWAKT